MSASFTQPCSGDLVTRWSTATIHIPTFPDRTSVGSVAFVEKILTDRDGKTPAVGQPIFAIVPGGISLRKNSDPPYHDDLWSQQFSAGLVCPGDRTRLQLRVYLLPPGTESAVDVQPDTAVTIPDGSTLLAQVDIARRDAPPDQCRESAVLRARPSGGPSQKGPTWLTAPPPRTTPATRRRRAGRTPIPS